MSLWACGPGGLCVSSCLCPSGGLSRAVAVKTVAVKADMPSDFFNTDVAIDRARSGAFQRRVDHLQTPRHWRTAAVNVLLKAPPSEQSVHVAVRCSCCCSCCQDAVRATHCLALSTIGMAHWKAAEPPSRRAVAARRGRIFNQACLCYTVIVYT